MKVSMLSIRAWALPMMNWFTQAIAWDLKGKGKTQVSSRRIGGKKKCFPNLMEMSGSLSYLILGLQCLKNWRNLGIIMLRGLFRASLSNSSDESSQIFCSAPNEPWDTDTHREAVKSRRKRTGHTGENETQNRIRIIRLRQTPRFKAEPWRRFWSVSTLNVKNLTFTLLQ